MSEGKSAPDFPARTKAA